MFGLRKSDDRVKELETSLRHRVAELQRKLTDPNTCEEERVKIRGILVRMSQRCEEESRSVHGEEKKQDG